MRAFIIFIVVVLLWMTGMHWAYTKFIKRATKPNTEESIINTSDMLEEQRRKTQQTREDQKRRMEDVRRKMRENQR